MNIDHESFAFEERIGLCVTSIRQYLIIYGGRIGYLNTETCNELWIYNTINGTCRRYPVPDEISRKNTNSSICTVENKVYLFGSLLRPLPDGTTYSLVSFDTSNFSWQDLSRFTNDDQQYSPPRMLESLLFYHDDSLYILGRIEHVRGDFIVSMCKLSLLTNIWSPVEQNGPTPIYIHEFNGTVFNNKLYTFGFTQGDGPEQYRFINIFDFYNNTWTSRETKSKTQMYPEPRFLESFAYSRSYIFISGGNGLGTYFSDIWRIDLENLEWIKLEITHERSVSMHGMAIIDDCYLYSFGGMRVEDYTPNTFERFILRPPTLYRLCLEYISRSPDLRSLTDFLPASIVDELD
ncbi:Kelch domain-containing protein 10 [Thelohanellus kitauei]|uniref:Kelch domain-containing protein 10 n=1 Tax=Thelohanellus kitauei TaxID=669202 RepID=A0A0C2MXH2_THEKT|nr:Kelch domain-containing protein 10 [Thelohanellus kitauei]